MNHPGQETAADRHALAAKTLKLERTLSDLVNQAYALTPAEIDLLWKTAPPRMPIPSARSFPYASRSADSGRLRKA